MSLRCARLSAACLAVLTLFTGSLRAQGDPQRDGMWVSVGLGGGSLACDRCGPRLSGLAGQLAVGGTVGGRWLIGVGTNGWTKSTAGATLTMNSLTAQARYYPTADARLFFLGGLGVGSLRLGLAQYGSPDATGASALLGLGYDIRLSHSTSLTAFWNAVAGSFDGSGANFGQLGLGLTHH